MATHLKELTALNELDFENFIKEKGSGVVEFGAAWCGACKVTEPILVGISKKYSDLKFFKIDVNGDSKLAAKMGVMSLPNIFFIKKGKIAEQVIGVASEKELMEKIKKNFS
jgi:thioredoxin 1